MKESILQDLIHSGLQVDKLFHTKQDISGEVERLIDTDDFGYVRKIYHKIGALASGYNNDIQKTKALVAFKDSLVKYLGHHEIDNILSDDEPAVQEETRTYSELIEELNSLIGLQEVKSKINDLVAFQKIQQLRKKHGLKTSSHTLHIAFMGNPGTGKTTVARIIGHLYKKLGLLSKGHFIEATRTDLIAGYQGQTAIKVKNIIDRAKGGVLFIDEAYSITENDHTDSYGRECLTELTKALEDYREDLVVIVAGYTQPMNHFFNSNQGLKSRFNTFVFFEDYSEDELKDILLKMVGDNGYTIGERTLPVLVELIHNALDKHEKDFPNGRYIRNLFEDLTIIQSRRLSSLSEREIDIDKLQQITIEDVESYMKGLEK